ncbi:hypothetical protein ABZ921_05360 [Streptomyces atriruber]|uniref:Uncharacterized protein n=1 Tax=Streptomyces atriruber TaxID=545121 RepID=A0ABV3BGA5_9ACTN
MTVLMMLPLPVHRGAFIAVHFSADDFTRKVTVAGDDFMCEVMAMVDFGGRREGS